MCVAKQIWNWLNMNIILILIVVAKIFPGKKTKSVKDNLILYNKEAEPTQSSHIVSSHAVGSGAKAEQIAQVPVDGNQAHYSGFTHVGVIVTVWSLPRGTHILQGLRSCNDSKVANRLSAPTQQATAVNPACKTLSPWLCNGLSSQICLGTSSDK